jgi:hypothetical protein
MSGISKYTSCRQIFKDYSILTVACLHILDTVYYIRKHKQFLEQNAQIHKYDTRRKLDLHVHFCNTDLFRKSVKNDESDCITRRQITLKNWTMTKLLKES